jgi:hypothetical protein
MKNTLLTFCLFVILFSFQPVAQAATSEVTWKDYESYRDILPGNGNKKAFREQTFKALEKHFSKLAAELPEKQILKIEVTDVDLAGDTHAGGINQFRIVKEIYIPRMEFNYQLVDNKRKVILADEVKLKDMSFMDDNSLKYRNKALGYEKKMLDDWFADTFKDLITNK